MLTAVCPIRVWPREIARNNDSSCLICTVFLPGGLLIRLRSEKPLSAGFVTKSYLTPKSAFGVATDRSVACFTGRTAGLSPYYAYNEQVHLFIAGKTPEWSDQKHRKFCKCLLHNYYRAMRP